MSNVAFVLANYYLSKLTFLLFNDANYANLTCFLFAFNPAGAFMSSFYTESIFALFSIYGIFKFYQNRLFFAALSWLLAALTRSNGVLLAGFFIYRILCIRNFKNFLKCLLYIAFVFSGFLIVQGYAFNAFCFTDVKRPWCEKTFPFIYGFVQTKYWLIFLILGTLDS